MFWDSSALVPVLFDEAGASSLGPVFAADSRPALWWGSPVESHAAIVRAVREKRISGTDATAAAERLRKCRTLMFEVAPIEDVRGRAIRVVTLHRLRATDALQLAAALIWSEEQPSGETFVCLDKRLREAARREGFTLLPAD